MVYGWFNITIHPLDEETKAHLEEMKVEKAEAASK